MVITIHEGDCLEVLKTLAENSIDAVVCDPPYHLTSIVKRFGAEGAAPAQFGKDEAFARASAGFMGKQWDGGDIAFRPETWALVLRVLKPGGHLVAFGGTRTYHRMACAIEDAGFEIRDCLSWLYATGFPKSHDISKAIDRAAGIWRGRAGDVVIEEQVAKGTEYERTPKGEPETEAAKQWAGFGTALKPSFEPICLARKPLSETTVAANVLRWGTGALNIDATRIEGAKDVPASPRRAKQNAAYGDLSNDPGTGTGWDKSAGRWPANLCHDGSPEVMAGFPESRGQLAAVGPANGPKTLVNVYGDYGPRDQCEPRGDSGSAARFFYTAKADADERLGSRHPTVKPVALMQWLVRLLTPPGATVLDPFAGTGTTGEAAWREGFNAILIERDPASVADIRRRMAHLMEPARVRKQTIVLAKGKAQSAGPLFETGGV